MFNSYALMNNFIAKHEHRAISSDQSITSERICRILQQIMSKQFDEPASLDNQYFKEILHQAAQTILNAAYRKQQHFIKIEHFVAYISTIQFIVHNQVVDLPKLIGDKLHKYIHSLIVQQDLLKIKSIYLDSNNSNILSNFYKNIYIKAFQHRYQSLLRDLGVYQKSGLIALLILQDIIEKSQYNLQVYVSNVTSQWVILSMAYYILAAKYRPMKQIPILSNILKKYYSTRPIEESSRPINGNQLCHFYNNIILAKIGGVQPYEVDKMIDEVIIDFDAVTNLMVSPIQSEDNTVLDNIVFSSSYQH